MKILTTLRMIIILLLINNVSIEAQLIQLGGDIDGEAAGDKSGWSVSLSADGSRLAIGALENSGNGAGAGHVRIYNWNGLEWTQLGEDIDGKTMEDYFGRSISMASDGNRLAVGADAGYTQVYEWNGSEWTQLGEDINGQASSDVAGFSVSLSDDGMRLAVGAPDFSGIGAGAGYAQVYEWNGLEWTQLGDDIHGEFGGDEFGYSVSLSSNGNRLAIGAPFNNGIGHVRVYNWNGMEWIQLGGDIDGEDVNDNSGFSITISSDGNRLAIGAVNNAGNGPISGHVRVYNWNGAEWIQLGEDIDGEAESSASGASVSFASNGNRLAIGAPTNDDAGLNVGHVRVYEWNGAEWTQLGEDIDGEATIDLFGVSVSFSSEGNRLAIGAINNDGNGNQSGHVRVFEGFDTISEVSIPKKESTSLSLFPNPAKNNVIITIENLTDTSKTIIELLDITGKMLYFESTENNNLVSLLNYPKGLYLVILRDLSTGQILTSKKLIVK